MALWLCRAGRIGEYETKFVEDNRIYFTWDDSAWNMSEMFPAVPLPIIIR